jgi:hypothetical protein
MLVLRLFICFCFISAPKEIPYEIENQTQLVRNAAAQVLLLPQPGDGNFNIRIIGASIEEVCVGTRNGENEISVTKAALMAAQGCMVDGNNARCKVLMIAVTIAKAKIGGNFFFVSIKVQYYCPLAPKLAVGLRSCKLTSDPSSSRHNCKSYSMLLDELLARYEVVYNY